VTYNQRVQPKALASVLAPAAAGSGRRDPRPRILLVHVRDAAVPTGRPRRPAPAATRPTIPNGRLNERSPRGVNEPGALPDCDRARRSLALGSCRSTTRVPADESRSVGRPLVCQPTACGSRSPGRPQARALPYSPRRRLRQPGGRLGSRCGNRRFSRYSLSDIRTPFNSRVRVHPRVIRRSVAVSHTPAHSVGHSHTLPHADNRRYWRDGNGGRRT
jgi:hypothetical protein